MDPPKESFNSSNTLLLPPTCTVTIQLFVKEPELVTILEDKPLTTEQLEQEQENAREELEASDEDPTEKTPLLGRSTETERSFTDCRSLTTSQASLFIPSVQFSLYSSRGHDFSRSQSRFSSAKISIQDDDSGSRDSKKFTVSLLEKLSEDGQASGILALWNVINMIHGSGGVLGIPYAIALGGYPALALVIPVGLMTAFAGIFLIDCLYEVSPKSGLRKRVRSSYAEIAADAWGPTGGRLVDFMTVAMCYCICILYVMMMGSTVMGLLKNATHLGLKEWCLICTCFLLPIVFIRKLSILAWLSMLAVVSLITCLFIIVGFSLGEWRSWSLHNIPDFNVSKFPIAIGIIVFSYCGHSVFPGIEGSMRKPKQFTKVVYTAFSLVTLSKVFFGLFCCLLFGASTESLVILNINHAAKNAVISCVAAVLLLINVYFSYPLNMYVATETLDILLLRKIPNCAKGKRYHIIWTVTTRTVLVFITLGIAVAVPNFGLLMSVFGSLLGACISFIFPCALHLTLKWKQLKWYTIAVEASIIIFGFIAGILGLIFSTIALKNS